MALAAGFVGTLGVIAVAAYALWPRADAPHPIASGASPPSAAPPPSIPEPQPAPATAPVPATDKLPSGVVERARAELTVETTPPGAIVTLDGAAIGRTPLTTWVVPGGGDRELRLELAGYRAETRVLVLDRSRALEVALRRATRKEPARTSEPE